MLIISTFYQGNFQQEVLIILILLFLRVSTYAYADALVKTSFKSGKRVHRALFKAWILNALLSPERKAKCLCMRKKI